MRNPDSSVHFESGPPELDPSILALRAKVDRLTGTGCNACDRILCGHDALFSVALGVLDRPMCLNCLAQSLARDARELRDHLVRHFSNRECYRHVWCAVTPRADGQPIPAEDSGGTAGRPLVSGDAWPSCCAPCHAPGTHTAPGTSPALPDQGIAPTVTNGDAEPPVWDAGDLSCGDLILQLLLRVRKLAPGTMLGVIARDQGAVEDIPAWCRLTGNHLLLAQHPHYRIQRKNG